MKSLLLTGAMLLATPAMALDTSFLMQNRSADILTEVHVGPPGKPSKDLLGTSVLGPKKEKMLRPPTNVGCIFNIMLTFSDGHQVGRSNVDLCTAVRISTTGAGVGVNW